MNRNSPIGKQYLESLAKLHALVSRGKRERKRPRTALIAEAAKRKIAEREGRG